MELSGKNVIALGERDGVQGTAIANCARSAGANVVLEVTHCFVWTSAGALDLEGQEEIKRVAQRVGTDDLVVILGTPNTESSKLYAITVTAGDPSWAGPLAGEALGLPVFHITEEQIKSQIDADVYEAEVGVVDMVLDVEDISAAIREVRLSSGAAD